MDNEGKKNFIRIHNDPQSGQPTQMQQGEEQSVNMFYDANALNVTVKAGASFQVQKSRTIMMVKEMMGMSEAFAAFVSTKGLPFILDNMEGKGIEQLKEMVDGWLKEQEEMKQRAMQMEEQKAQQNPMALKMQVDMQKLQHEAKKDEAQFAVDMAKIQLEKEKTIINAQMGQDASSVQLVKAMTERMAKATDLAIKKIDVAHKHNHDYDKLRHEIIKSHRDHESKKMHDRGMQR
jgi:hypothetical protein